VQPDQLFWRQSGERRRVVKGELFGLKPGSRNQPLLAQFIVNLAPRQRSEDAEMRVVQGQPVCEPDGLAHLVKGLAGITQDEEAGDLD